ncbi:hypothetical protein [Adhaeribacter swui]|nr:hypothetical protein [Adhaeribacter swui]
MYKTLKIKAASPLLALRLAFAKNKAGFNYAVGGCAPMRSCCCCG